MAKVDLSKENIEKIAFKIKQYVLEGNSITLSVKMSGVSRGGVLHFLISKQKDYLEAQKIAIERKKISNRGIKSCGGRKLSAEEIEKFYGKDMEIKKCRRF